MTDPRLPDRGAIAAMIPHAGAMCLLDRVERWDATCILARATSHLDASNPLRTRGQLPVSAGVEYGLQAAAVHGALLDGLDRSRARQAPGYLVSLRRVRFAVSRLDVATYGTLRIEARLIGRQASGLLLSFVITAQDDTPLLDGRAGIAFPSPTS